MGLWAVNGEWLRCALDAHETESDGDLAAFQLLSPARHARIEPTDSPGGSAWTVLYPL